MVGCICDSRCHVCGPLSLVCYCLHPSFLGTRSIADYWQYNFLSDALKEPPRHPLFWWLLRLAFIGFCASVVSDTISNSLRVVKTYRQVNDTKVSYSESPTRKPYLGSELISVTIAEAARAVIAQDGTKGLLGRGLKTRILANGLQGLLFSILWKIFLDL